MLFNKDFWRWLGTGLRGNRPRDIGVEIPGGVMVRVPDDLEHLTSYILREQGDWFEAELPFLRRAVGPGMTVVDVGASYGTYALSLGRRVLPGGAVWAFEPAPEVFRFLESSVRANGFKHVHLTRAAVSEAPGTGTLVFESQSELRGLGPAGAAGETVDLVSLDESLERHGWASVDVLKLDAEGAETAILRGARRLLANHSPLVMAERLHGDRVDTELVEAFRAQGYAPYFLVPGPGILAPWDETEGDPWQLNLFFCKPDRARALAERRFLALSDGLEARSAGRGDALEAPPWQEAVAGRAYASRIGASWAPAAMSPGHAAALGWLGASRDAQSSPAARYEALREAARLLERDKALPSPAQRLTRFRVLAELGQRSRALELLESLLGALPDVVEGCRREPFAAPSAAFEALDPQDRFEDWLKAGLLDAAETLGSFSGYFTGADSLARLSGMAVAGFLRPPMARRLDWLRRRMGLG